jgi:KaiC/GvpD/RAD55 family RecA-like ATPase
MTAQDTERRFEFLPGLPVPGVPAGTNLLVSGRGGDGVKSIALDLLTSGGRKEGLICLSTDTSAEELYDRILDQPNPITRSTLGLIDCSAAPSPDDPRFGGHQLHIDGPGDLSTIELEFSLLYEKLLARDVEQIRVGVVSLTTLLEHSPLRPVSRFFHMLTGRVIATGDLGVYVVDTAVQDARTTETLQHYCDGHVEVQATENGPSVRVTGLEDATAEWQPVDYEIHTHEPPENVSENQ